MSGNTPTDNETPRVVPVLDDATSAAISALVSEQILAALAKLPTNANATTTAQGAPVTDTEAAEPSAPGTEPAIEPTPVPGAAANQGTVSPANPVADAPEAEVTANEGDEFADYDNPEEVVQEPEPPGSQAFTSNWYEIYRGSEISPRFTIPPRLDPVYPVGFRPESVEHYRLFSAPGTSLGRAEEASNLYNAAAYLTEASNGLCRAVEDLLEATSGLPEDKLRDIKAVIVSISDAQLTTYGVYELTATRYEVLAGKQGAVGVADPDILASITDAPAAYSSAGRQAFRRQQAHAIKYATQRAGRKFVNSTSPVAGAGTGGSSGGNYDPAHLRGGKGSRGSRRGRGRRN